MILSSCISWGISRSKDASRTSVAVSCPYGNRNYAARTLHSSQRGTPGNYASARAPFEREERMSPSAAANTSRRWLMRARCVSYVSYASARRYQYLGIMKSLSGGDWFEMICYRYDLNGRYDRWSPVALRLVRMGLRAGDEIGITSIIHR